MIELLIEAVIELLIEAVIELLIELVWWWVSKNGVIVDVCFVLCKGRVRGIIIEYDGFEGP